MIRIVVKICSRLAIGVLAGMVFVAGTAIYNFYTENSGSHPLDSVGQLSQEIRRLQAQIPQVREKVKGCRKKLRDMGEELKTLERQLDFWTNVLAWATLWGEDYRNWYRLRKKRADLLAQKGEVERELGVYERVLQEKILEKAEKEKRLEESPVVFRLKHHFLSAFWKYFWGMIVFMILFVFPVGKWLWKTFCWYGPAAFLDRFGKPLVFKTDRICSPAEKSLTRKDVSQKVTLSHGEEGVFKPRFVLRSVKQEKDKAGTMILFNRYIFLCLICRLWGLIRFEPLSSAHDIQLTISSATETDLEFSVIQLGPEDSLIIRPSFLAGLIYPRGRKPILRTHWFLWRWHSWITLQFRYIELCGPARLVAWGYRGLRVEKTESAPGMINRVNPEGVIAFCPKLKYQSRRSEALGAYLFFGEPLFNDVFSGEGIFICQETAVNPGVRGVRKFWAGFFDGLLRLGGF